MRMSCLLCVALVAAAPEARAQEPGPVEVVRAFYVALETGDSAAAINLLTPDVVVLEAGGVEASRDEYASHHLGSDMAFVSSVTREVMREFSGMEGDVAWVLGEARVRGTFRERPVDSVVAETMILRRTPAGWRIAHIHWSSRRAPGN
jgi:ketosteroid isomerase-like protein